MVQYTRITGSIPGSCSHLAAMVSNAPAARRWSLFRSSRIGIRTAGVSFGAAAGGGWS
jgi:hypothetical protein